MSNLSNLSNLNVKILPCKLGGTVKAIASKSQAHRALICAALAHSPTDVKYDTTCDDIDATVECLAALKRGCTVLNCKESASTYRFLIPVAAALGVKAEYKLEGRLAQRPLLPLFEELVRTKKRLKPASYTIDAGVSSQFISGLLFALPLLEADSEIHLTGEIQSAPYVDLTVEMLEMFGIKVKFNDGVFYIAGNQVYKSPGTIHVEGDWSNAAFWLCADAVCDNSVTVTGLNKKSKQGDKKIIEILNQLTVNRPACTKGHHLTVNCQDIPDLVPILSVVAAASKGVTVIGNAARLRLKESDRLTAVTEMLSALGADITEKEDGLIINGGIALKGGIVSSCNDHRIAMSAAIAATLCKEPVIIKGARAVNKSYPGFFKDFESLGGKIV
jgi:3-phosphoshikimate 1-carboxyvinyltransferase